MNFPITVPICGELPPPIRLWDIKDGADLLEWDDWMAALFRALLVALCLFCKKIAWTCCGRSERYPKAWGRYGFVDAFNPLTGWYDPDALGIDLGITMLMTENVRSGFVWNTFMKNGEMQRAMEKAGFKASARSA